MADPTRLEWSDAIGKRVRSGGWADQAVPTLDKVREALAEAGDEFGLRAGRREVAPQLVNSFMEEAKVVYLIYKVWTAGFLDWLASQGVSDAERRSESTVCRASWPIPMARRSTRSHVGPSSARLRVALGAASAPTT